ncbi:MAG: EAL domain-containing response regulator [Casimicrobiaceae bacterium]
MTFTNLHFLVAEDHDFQRGALVRMLERLGAACVHEAADGHAALSIIQDPTRRVDIVISDLDMPGMDGMEFIRRMSQARQRVSIILASAMERTLMASVVTMARAYGVILLGVVEKPPTARKLEPLIKRHEAAQVEKERRKSPDLRFGVEAIAAGLKNDEFEPFFQPKVELATGHVRRAEALARWRHPQHGVVAPYAFIGPLEESGLIDELTWIMVTKAAAFCRTWRATGLDATVSVNLSHKSLGDVELADRITRLIRAENVEPCHMTLEITETAAATDVPAALENLARLRMKGFGLSIDDYGTGYSSMQQLARSAFTELKLDQSFVTNASHHDSAKVMLESSLNIARKLNITAVAEGVETQEDWNLLRQLGCGLAQGYLIARPMDAGVCLGWVKEWKGIGRSRVRAPSKPLPLRSKGS